MNGSDKVIPFKKKTKKTKNTKGSAKTQSFRAVFSLGLGFSVCAAPKPPKRGPFSRKGLFELRSLPSGPGVSPSTSASHPPRPAFPRRSPRTHVQAGVVGEQPIVTQGHVLLLPFLVQGLATPLEQDALRTEAGSEAEARPTRHSCGEGLGVHRSQHPPPPVLPGHCAYLRGEATRD